MINKRPFLKNFAVLFLAIMATISCNQEVNLTFSESNFKLDKNAIIEINIPIADGKNATSEAINSAVEKFIVTTLSFNQDSIIKVTLDDAVKNFDSIYVAFRDDFEEHSLIWEALIDSEVTYESPIITSIAINSYLNTGGAHGNMNISFLNFNSQTGALLQIDDFINDKNAFTKLAKTHFENLIQESDELQNEDYFWGEGFHLPANIGFSDEGLILLYNVYEIASYSQGLIEFTIPFEEVLPYLKLD